MEWCIYDKLVIISLKIFLEEDWRLRFIRYKEPDPQTNTIAVRMFSKSIEFYWQRIFRIWGTFRVELYAPGRDVMFSASTFFMRLNKAKQKKQKNWSKMFTFARSFIWYIFYFILLDRFKLFERQKCGRGCWAKIEKQHTVHYTNSEASIEWHG